MSKIILVNEFNTGSAIYLTKDSIVSLAEIDIQLPPKIPTRQYNGAVTQITGKSYQYAVKGNINDILSQVYGPEEASMCSVVPYEDTYREADEELAAEMEKQKELQLQAQGQIQQSMTQKLEEAKAAKEAKDQDMSEGTVDTEAGSNESTAA